MAISNNVEVPLVTRKYEKVVITLNNVLLPPEKLFPSPSTQDGLDTETELDLRILGCEMIHTSGILLKLPQVAMATGQVLFQRFYYAKSFVRYPMEATAMACIALASKIEEAPRKIRDVINVFHHIRQVKGGKTIQPVILDSNYIALKNQVIKAERRILKELGFCCHVKHPHKIIIMYLRLLEADENHKLAQSSWNYMNDALRTDVFVRYSPETIACACIWLAGRQLKYALPESPPWYLVFRVDLPDIEFIAAAVLKLYCRKKIKLEVLEQKVDEIRKEQQEARLRNKAVASLTTPKEVNTFSPLSRSNTPGKCSHSPKRSSSPERGKRDKRSSSHSRSSKSPHKRRGRKKARRSSLSPSCSRSRSQSHSAERSHSRERYSKKYSRTPSPAVTPPPRFIKNREKGPIVRSVSRSRSRSPHHGYERTSDKYNRVYDKYSRGGDKHERLFDKADHYDRMDRFSKSDSYDKLCRVDKYEVFDKSRYDLSKEKVKYDRDKMEKNDRYEVKEKIKKYPKLEKKKESKRDANKYDNGYDKQHKPKKAERGRSESRDRRR